MTYVVGEIAYQKVAYNWTIFSATVIFSATDIGRMEIYK